MGIAPRGDTIQKQHICFKLSHYWETGLTRGWIPETAVKIILVANEAGLAALGTLQKERNMRASLLRAMESGGDWIDSRIVHAVMGSKGPCQEQCSSGGTVRAQISWRQGLPGRKLVELAEILE